MKFVKYVGFVVIFVGAATISGGFPWTVLGAAVMAVGVCLIAWSMYKCGDSLEKEEYYVVCMGKAYGPFTKQRAETWAAYLNEGQRVKVATTQKGVSNGRVYL
jgi:hypothetical protein